MKKLTMITLLSVATFSTAALANSHQGGFHGGGFAATQAVSKVSELASMKDDQYVVLQGKIVQQVGNDDFLFRDASGEVTVEIEGKAWAGQNVSPTDEVKLYGEVDQSWHKTEVEIHRVEKVQ